MGDSVLTAVTEDGSFRVVAAQLGRTAAGIVAAQRAAGPEARLLSQLVTGVALYRVTMAPHLRVQGILRGAAGRGHAVADSHPEGWCRGLLGLGPGTRSLDTGEGAMLQMMRTMPNGDLVRGVVEVGDADGLSAAVTRFMRASEQVECVVHLACADPAGRAPGCGGLLVQLLPEAVAGALEELASRLSPPPPDAPPEAMIAAALTGVPYAITSRRELRYECPCTRVRVMTSLSTLGRADIEELLEGGETLSIDCDYCGAHYEVAPEELRGLLATS